MNENEAEKRALQLMQKHFLCSIEEKVIGTFNFIYSNGPWRFRWLRNGTYRCYGLCEYKQKRICLNKDFVIRASEEEVIDVILHEIAHALAFIRFGRSQKHNENWKAICREIGANPNRLYEGNVKLRNELPTRQPKYVLRHKETKKVYREYRRKPGKRIIASVVNGDIWIRGQKAETLGKLELVYKVNRPLVQGIT